MQPRERPVEELQKFPQQKLATLVPQEMNRHGPRPTRADIVQLAADYKMAKRAAALRSGCCGSRGERSGAPHYS